ncbi:poly(hydroxyalkanoate) depolymerase family esterase [Catenulispora sp. EB89]|uniref:extracellular catalytic domain type 1 short-chain-length polyhydroxyalkanoate depolymerase n=1 Tax=Catenulispora sp. EB89 TaxID=3156257 RepID=UPI0035164928
MPRTSRTTPTTGRRRGALAALAAALLTLAASALTLSPSGASPAHAASSLNQVTNFGSNPGNLAMYSYVPQALPQGAPLVVALHGCTQTATDYYDHSGWSQFADQWGFTVVFPQTSSANNSLSCFSWFDSTKDTRGNGEAASVAAMVSYAESHYGSDPHRVYVTGLSAGAGLTADLLADYPDVFAGGAIDSGLPAQCATTQSAASSCQMNNQNLTPAQWGDKVRNSDPGYTGPWPRVAIWQGSADYTVYPVNATELRDQWTNAWGISQTASSTQTLSGGTTESVYNDGSGKPAVEMYSISGMGHGLAVDPGSGTAQCGSTGAYFLSYICSTYYTATFWGLNSGTPPTSTPSTTPPTTPSTTPSTPPTSSSSSSAACFTATNYAQTVAGRAYQSGGYTYADGSNQNMGLWNVFVTHTLKETGPNYYVIADSGC